MGYMIPTTIETLLQQWEKKQQHSKKSNHDHHPQQQLELDLYVLDLGRKYGTTVKGQQHLIPNCTTLSEFESQENEQQQH